MEDVLEVYHLPHDPDYPVVCVDETLKQLVVETRVPIPTKPGQPARYDYEYERNGTANLFMMFAPLEGWRHVEVTDRHTALDYAQVLEYLSDTRFPSAKQIRLVQDNLNTHKPASLYEAFPAPEARRLFERFVRPGGGEPSQIVPFSRRFGAFVRGAVVVGAMARVSSANSAIGPRVGGRDAGANDLPHQTSPN